MARATQTYDEIDRTALRFFVASDLSKWTMHYVLFKLRSDPSTRVVAKLAPLGDVLDIGCGRGQLAIYLLELDAARSVRGYDWDAEKVAFARRAAEGLDATFDTKDVRETTLDDGASADSVLLIDVLHYLPVRAQDELIDCVADLVRPGGRLIIREATKGYGWRSALTVGVEYISKTVRLNVGERIKVRDMGKEIVPRLEAKGLRCTIEPCWDGTPFANVLLIASRP